LDPDPEPEPDPAPLVRGTDPGAGCGSAPKCHGSPTMVFRKSFTGLFISITI
jgi:hypothetical protein